MKTTVSDGMPIDLIKRYFMHRDKKIGFALGILLIGIVAAFFFRNEPDPFAELPPLDDPAALDGRIAENPIAPYTDDSETSGSKEEKTAGTSQWELPEIYRKSEEPISSETDLPSVPAAPAPINLDDSIPEEPDGPESEMDVRNTFADPTPNSSSAAPLPGNADWTIGPQHPEAAEKPTAESADAREKPAQAPVARATTYRIQQGDTLSVLAEEHLGSSRRYMEIYEANRDKLESPDDIQVGMRIRLPSRVKFPDDGGQKKSADQPASTEKQSIPPGEKAGRFRPFSRSPLGPTQH